MRHLALEFLKPDQTWSISCRLEHSLGNFFSGGQAEWVANMTPCGHTVVTVRAQSAFLSTFVNMVLSPERPGSLASRVCHVGQRASLILQAAWPPEKSWTRSQLKHSSVRGEAVLPGLGSPPTMVLQTTRSIWWLLRTSHLGTVGGGCHRVLTLCGTEYPRIGDSAVWPAPCALLTLCP